MPAIAADGDPVSISQYLKGLSRDNKFQVVGLEMVGADTFMPYHKQVSVDRAVGRALAGYNYIVNYDGDHITKVLILGKKGASVGTMPSDLPAPPPPEEVMDEPEPPPAATAPTNQSEDDD